LAIASSSPSLNYGFLVLPIILWIAVKE